MQYRKPVWWRYEGPRCSGKSWKADRPIRAPKYIPAPLRFKKEFRKPKFSFVDLEKSPHWKIRYRQHGLCNVGYKPLNLIGYSQIEARCTPPSE